jgi:hypothetical protein
MAVTRRVLPLETPSPLALLGITLCCLPPADGEVSDFMPVHLLPTPFPHPRAHWWTRRRRLVVRHQVTMTTQQALQYSHASCILHTGHRRAHSLRPLSTPPHNIEARKRSR